MQPMTIFAKAKQLTSTVTWELKKDGTLIISGTGKMPDMGRNKYPWAKKASKIISVTIGEGITTIGSFSFSNFDDEPKHKQYQIKSVSFPSTLKSIEAYAFHANYISSITLPSSLEKIEWNAFTENNIRELSIPDGVSYISSQAFSGCGITELTLPSSLKIIGFGAFAHNNISVLNIPEGVTLIDKFAFSGCGITKLTLPSSLETINESAFQENNISDLTIPSSVKSIGHSAFELNNISTLTIQEGVTEIKKYAFAKALTSNSKLYVASSVKSIGYGAFAIRLFPYDRTVRDHFEGTLLNLPSYITENNCYEIGISSTAYRKYNPSDYDLFMIGNDYLFKKNDAASALNYFLKGTTARKYSENSTIRESCYLQAGKCYSSLGDLHNALKFYEKAQMFGIEEADGFITLIKYRIEKQVNDSLEVKYRDVVQEALRKNNYALAFDYYVKLYKILRCETEELLSIPKYFEDKKDYATAIKYYKEVYEVQDQSLWAANHIAELYLNIKDYEGAVEWASIHAQRGDKEGQYKLAQVYEKAKNKNLAIFWYKKAAEQKHLKAEEALAHYGIYINTQHNTASSQQTTQTSSSQSKASSSNSQSNSYTPEYGLRDVWVQCWVCHGSGKCEHCNGNGQYISTRGDGSFNSLDKCQPCYGSGRCSMCNGTGGHYEKQSYQIR